MGGMANVLGDKRVGKARRDVLPWVYLMVFLVGIVAVVGFTWYHIANERRGALEHWRARLSTFADDRARLVLSWLDARRAAAGVLARAPPSPDDRAPLVLSWLNARRPGADVLAGSPAVRAVLSGEGDRGVAGQL